MRQNLNQELTCEQIDKAAESICSVSDIYKTLKKDIENRTGVIKYKVGIDALDEVIWGLHKKELLVYGARTSNGKSTWAVNTVKNLCDAGHKVIYFSLEMSKEQLLEKLLSNVCGINGNLLRTGKALKELNECEETFLKWLDNIKLTIDDTSGYNFDDIITICRLLNPDFVFVDYIQMVSTKGYPSKLDAIEDFVKEIHRLGKFKNFGTVLISQINRQGVDRPYLEHLKNSGILEEHPDTVILAQWNWEKDEYTMWVEKQRHGPTGKVVVKFEPQFSRFRDFDITDRMKEYEANTHQSNY